MQNKVIVIFILLFSKSLIAQIPDETREALVSVMTSPQVEPRVFYSYPDGTWNGAFQLKGGRYAFVCPDTTFQKVYPGILDEFPYSIATDSLLGMKKLFQDSVKKIYVKHAGDRGGISEDRY
jgi:hypothetical protein